MTPDAAPAAPRFPAAALQLTGLVAERAGRRLWGPLDLTLHPGQAVHLAGPNGSGKTTLLRTLAGLHRPVAGAVQRPSSLWFIGHASPLADELDATTNLRLWLAMAGAVPAEAAVQAVLAQAGVPRQRPVRQLSAGQRRKITLAPLALVARPLWLLDEPLDALDDAGCQLLARWAAEHLAAGGMLVMSSHQALPPGFPACGQLRLGAPSVQPVSVAEGAA